MYKGIELHNSLKSLHNSINNCRICEDNFKFAPRPITWGQANSKIVQISQAPSKTVHETGIPFNDISGKRLRNWYEISSEDFYNKANFYITAISHCFPGKGKISGDNKPPSHCADKWLFQELSLVKNEIYLIVGSYAAKYIFPGNKFKDLVFQDQLINNKPAFVLPHPSPLNIKWIKDHSEFNDYRLPIIKETIHRLLKSD